MKQSIIFFRVCMFGSVAFAQKMKESDVPASVKQNFAKVFPKAVGVKWAKENSEELEAEFKQEGKEMSANFKLDGTWAATETEIKKSELPKGVQNALATEYSDYQIKEIEKAEAPGKPIAYELEVEKGETKWEIRFSEDGNVIHKEEKKEKAD
jgi:uncharacterized membrane protein YkoI